MTGRDSNPVISLRNIGVCFRRHTGILRSRENWALNDVSFDVFHGEVVGLIGPNGAGKSTVLRVIADIIRPDRGTVLKDRGYSASLLALQVGFLPYLSGRENIYLSGMLLGMSKRMLKARTQQIIEFSELAEFIDDPVWTYSVGMKARLGFAIANEADPDIMLLDEMFGVGDAEFKRKSRRAMEEKIRTNRTVMIASHSMNTIGDICDRVIWIERGRIAGIGLPGEIIPRYEKRGRRPAQGAPAVAPDGAVPLPVEGSPDGPSQAG